MPGRSLLPVSLLALALAFGGACFSSAITSRSSGTAGTGGASSDGGHVTGSGGTGGATGAGGGDVVFPDAGVMPVTAVPAPGSMVLDGDGLVLISFDAAAGVGSLVRLAIGSWAVTPVVLGSTAMSVTTALTADAERFYFFGSDALGKHAIYSYPRAGGAAPLKIADVGAIAGTSGGAAIAVDATRVYWFQFATDPTLAGGAVMTAPIGGGPAVELATIDAPDVPSGGIAVDATRLYWTTTDPAQAQGNVYAMPLPSGAPVSIYTGSGPQQVTSDGATVYVLDVGLIQGDCAPNWGSLVAIPVGGGATKTLNDTLYAASSFALGAGRAYIATGSNCEGTSPNGTVIGVSLTGEATTGLASGPWQPISLVVDGANVYLSEYGGPSGVLQIGAGP